MKSSKFNTLSNKMVIHLELRTIQLIIILGSALILVPNINFWANLMLLLYLAFIIASLLRQLADKTYIILQSKLKFVKQYITKKHIYAGWFLLTLILFWFTFFNLTIQVLNQTSQLITQFILTPEARNAITLITEKLPPTFSKDIVLNAISNFFSSILSFQNTLESARGTLSIIPYIIFIFFATWYILIDRDIILNAIINLLPGDNDREKVKYIFSKLDLVIGRWAKAQLLLMLIIGFMTYIALLILGVPYPLPLAVLAGLLEVVPTFGPLLSAIPAAIVAFVTGGISTLLLTLLAYFLIQQLENSVIVPKVMQTITGLHPLITVLLITTGQALFGPLGAILSVPIYVTLIVILEETKKFNRA